MSIFYDETTKTFYLENERISYAFSVTDAGVLTHRYFGGRIGRDDLRFTDRRDICSFSANPAGGDNRKSADLTPAEYPVYGRGDFREGALLVQDGTGSRLLDLVYKRHEVLSVKPALSGMPSVSGGETLVVELEDALTSVSVKLYYTVCGALPAVARHAEIVNGGKSAVTLLSAMSFCLDLPDMDYEAVTLYGAHAAERRIQRAPLQHGIQLIESTRGTSSHQYNPFLALTRRETTEKSGEAYGVNLVYSGSFRLQTECDQCGTTRLTGGIDPYDFSWLLAAGERFATPEAILAYTDEGLGALSRAYHDLYRDCLIPSRFVRSARPIVINNWEATYFAFDRDKLFALIDSAAELGVDTFVLDDGWFGVRNDDSSALGDWTVNTKKLQGGLAPVIERCHSRGLKFGLWFEPEMISENSDLYRAHPDWCVHAPGRKPAESRNQLVLDITRPEALDYIKKSVSAVLESNDISYVKWDMNRHITENFSSALPPERQREFQHRYVLAVYELAGYLTDRFPHVFFEGCSGGGGRFDAAMLRYFPQYWTSDDTDAYQRAFIQYGTSLCYPLSAMSAHVSVCPNHQTGRVTPLAARGAMASLGATGYELDVTALSEAERAEIKAQTAAYRRVADLILNGDLYRLVSPYETGDFAMEVLSKDGKRGYIVHMAGLTDAMPTEYRLKLDGLDPAARYLVEEAGLTLSGATLMRVGIPLGRKHTDYQTTVFHLERVD